MGLKGQKTRCYLTVLSQDSDLNYNVELAVMRSGWNINNWNYQNVEQYKNTFLGTPILCAYLPDGTVGGGHNMSEKTLPSGEKYYDFTDGVAERIVGAISDNADDITTKEKDGETWIYAKGKLWRFYNRKLVDKIARQGRMEVSAETEIFEEHEESGGSVFTNWRGIGVTILGDKVPPAIPGANIQALKAASQKFNEVKLAAASYHPNNQKPQEKTKGVKTMKNLGKHQIAELSAKFTDYTVLAGAESDNGIHICLMSESGDPCVYEMQSLDEAVVAERIQKVTVNAAFAFGEESIDVDVCAMTDALSASAIKANSALEAANAELNKANDTIKAMQDAETTRRVNSAKATAKATLEAFNANRENKIDADAIADITADIEKGIYTNSVNENGEWTGDKAVENAVFAVCGRKVAEIDAKSKKNYQSWEGFKGNSAEAGTVGELFHKN